MIPDFTPLPFLRGPWAQTIAAELWPQWPSPRPTHVENVALGDGDELVVWENRPSSWRENGRIALLVHGLTGSAAEGDAVRLTRKLLRSGIMVVRVNLRGCGPGFGWARKPYHAGCSNDLRAIVQRWMQRFPAARLTLVGFSLGGNVVLKYAGEEAGGLSEAVERVVAISAPIDLQASSLRLSSPENWLFDRYFVKRLIKVARRQHARFPETEVPIFPDGMKLRGFDDFYTAPRSGFRDAAEYYEKASSFSLIPAIRCRLLLLGAEDDPVVDTNVYRKLPIRKGHDVVLTSRGGHVGFLGFSPGVRGVRWLDEFVGRWVIAK